MKAITSFVLLAALTGVEAASLQNLDFESANTNNVRDEDGIQPIYLFGPGAEVVPGWQIYLGINAETRVGLDVFLTGSGYSSLMSPNNRIGLPVEGKYSLALVPRTTGPNPSQFTPYSVLQSGAIPPGVKSIHFVNYGQPFDFYVNGSLVPLAYAYRPGNENPNTRLADASGDISRFAGMNVELKLVTAFQMAGRIYGLDSISFSDIAIPEPSTLVLSFLGVVILTARLLRRPWFVGSSSMK